MTIAVTSDFVSRQIHSAQKRRIFRSPASRHEKCDLHIFFFQNIQNIGDHFLSPVHVAGKRHFMRTLGTVSHHSAVVLIISQYIRRHHSIVAALGYKGQIFPGAGNGMIFQNIYTRRKSYYTEKYNNTNYRRDFLLSIFSLHRRSPYPSDLKNICAAAVLSSAAEFLPIHLYEGTLLFITFPFPRANMLSILRLSLYFQM